MRPDRFSEPVMSKVIEGLLPEVLRWLNETDEDKEEFEFLKQQLASALEEGEYDAYQTAKYLEDMSYWSVDGGLITILSSAVGKSYKHHDIAVSEWVTQEGIEPKFQLGDLVSFRRSYQNMKGEVTTINRKLASYTVYCESLGHVRSGIGTLGCVVPFEDATLSSNEAK